MTTDPWLRRRNLTEFKAAVFEYLMQNPQQRLGQAAFNVLSLRDNDLANQVRGDRELDPFYVDDKVDRFFDWLADRL